MTSIALVTQGLGYGGGIPSSVHWLRSQLLDHGYEVTVVDLATSSRDDLSRRLRHPATLTRRSLRDAAGDQPETVRWGANAVELEVMRYRPRRELTRFLDGFDLVHVLAGGAALGCVASRSHPPLVLQVATSMRWERQRTLATAPTLRGGVARVMTHLVDALETRALRDADAVLVMNGQMVEQVEAVTGHPPVKATLGIDTDVFCPRESGWAPEGHLLSVCRLADARKGLHRLVEAYRIALERDPALPPLLLAGLGPAPADLSAQVAHGDLAGRVEIRTDVPVDQLPALVRGASTYLQASYEEGLGISLLEAAASGVPAVATRTAGTDETVLHGRTGILVEQGDDATVSRALADGIVTARSRGAELARAAREFCVAEYSTREMVHRHLQVYARLLREPQAVSA